MAELTMARWTRAPSGPSPWATVTALAGLPAPDAASVMLLSARIDLEADDDDMTFVHLLSRAERDRLERFKVQSARQRFLVGRGLMRSVLARVTGCDARRVALVEGEYGKPALDATVHTDPIRFNLSHSGDRILIGFTRMGEVGVDIEKVQERRMMDEILERNFHPEERAEIREAQAFCHGWAAKEAVVKAMGHGIGYPTGSFSVAPLLRGEAEMDVTAGDRTWRCAGLNVCDGYAAALAVEAD